MATIGEKSPLALSCNTQRDTSSAECRSSSGDSESMNSAQTARSAAAAVRAGSDDVDVPQ